MSSEKVYKLAVVPKETINPFYDQVHEGCQDMAKLLPNTECVYVGPDSVDADEQASIIRKLINSSSVDGISMAVIDAQIASELAQEALDANIPFITFDSDAPDSARLMYVGTDNFEFGQSLAKVLLQLSPKGGVYGIIDAAPPNVALRSEGFRYRLQNTRWVESPESPKDCLDSIPLSLQHMHDYAALAPHINAIIPVGGWPMRDPDNWKIFVDANRNLTLNVGDTDPNQLSLLAKTYVDGLVGQVPYQMGTESIRLLLELANGKPVPQELLTTSLVEVVRIPLSLPRVVVNQNQIDNLKYIGFVAVGISFVLSIGFIAFTWIHRKKRVIKAAQPVFLYMIAIGVIVMTSAIIPLSIDDSYGEHTQEQCNIACMSYPWLICIGFVITFSALFAKTWRVNKIFQTHHRFVRKEVSEKDVIVPFVSLLLANILVLSLWTALAPLTYIRQPHPGTDDWHRVISTYGVCASSNAAPYMITLAVMNVGLLIVANVQAYKARSIQSEFSESKYIWVVMASMLQTCIIGVPIVFLVYDNPPAVYLVVTFMLFLTGMTVLLLIFVPKVHFLRMYTQSPEEIEKNMQRQMRASVPTSHFYEDRKSYQATKSSSMDLAKPVALEECRRNPSSLLRGDDSRSFSEESKPNLQIDDDDVADTNLTANAVDPSFAPVPEDASISIENDEKSEFS